MTNLNSKSEAQSKTATIQNFPVIAYMKFLGEIVYVLIYSVWDIIFKFVKLIQPTLPKSIKGEIVLVTGGANGIGREICLRLVKTEPQLTIIIWDIDETKAKATVKELEELGVEKAYYFLLDTTDHEQVVNGARNIQEKIGDVSILFNNAGIAGEVGEGWKMNHKIVEKVFQVNLISHCWVLQEFLPGMVKKGKGHVIETCSIGGLMCGSGGSPYIASKHAVRAYVECIKEDIRYLPQTPDIHFTLVYPEVVLTNMTKDINFRAAKYPFLVRRQTGENVGRKMVEGMLRNEEHIYIPWIYRFLPTLVALSPEKVFQRVMDCYKIEYNKTC